MLSIDNLVIDYGDAQAEAKRCRQDCALFDFSFVYRLRVSGRKVIEFIEAFQSRKVEDMALGQIRYSVKCDKNDRVRSDLTIWRFGPETFEVMSGHVDDVIELQNMACDHFMVENLSESHAILAIQGPNSLSRLKDLVDRTSLETLAYFHFAETDLCGIPCLVGRLGYSGEAGFEFLFDLSQKDYLWKRLSAEILPAGFSAIDILRIEAGFFLFTQECLIEPTTSELGLSVSGTQPRTDPKMRLMAFTAQLAEGLEIGHWKPEINRYSRPAIGEISITSACFSPTLNSIIGLGFVDLETKSASVSDPENKFYDIEVNLPPLFDPHKTRPRMFWSDDTRVKTITR